MYPMYLMYPKYLMYFKYTLYSIYLMCPKYTVCHLSNETGEDSYLIAKCEFYILTAIIYLINCYSLCISSV